MKKLLFSLMLSTFWVAASAQPLWMRYPAISPSGSSIAFAYKGDIYIVDASGGTARQITTASSYESNPIWSTDGKSIAFSSNRYGNNDIFIVSAQGGEPTRLTTDSYNEVPTSFTPDGKHVLFTTSRKPLASNVLSPKAQYSQTYKVSVNGGRPELVLPVASERTQYIANGSKIIYHDVKGSEDKWRKHHTSSVTRDIWIYDTKNDSYTKLTDNKGEDRDPVFSADGSKIYYLAERNGGTFNVWSMDTANPKNVKSVSSFKTHPVRFLTGDNNGTLCYGYHGEIYTQKEGKSPEKVKINIINDTPSQQIVTLPVGNSYSYADITPDGKQIAFITRGEVFVNSTLYKQTKRISNTVSEEKGVSISPDGKLLVYGSSRDGVWNVYVAKVSRQNEIDFGTATLVEEKPLLPKSNVDRSMPKFSPDGKEVAYIENRNKLMVYNLATKKSRIVTTGKFHPRNDTGGFTYSWSPNGKWFAMEYIANGHDPYSDVGIVSANGGDITNITSSGYMSGNPRWTPDGTAVIFMTEKYGMRNHASWGSMNDIMIAFVNQDAFDKFKMNKEDYELMKAEAKHAASHIAKANEAKKANTKGNKKDATPTTKVEPKAVQMELDGIADRVLRLTPSSANLGDAIVTPDGSKLYYLAAFEGRHDLWEINLRTRMVKMAAKLGTGGGLEMDRDGKTLYLFTSNSINKINPSNGAKSIVPIQSELKFDLAAEREYMLNHVYVQEKKRFYVTDMHGVKWDDLYKAYVPQLAHINNNFDFSELLSELLGELNVSHTGSGYGFSMRGADNVAELGVFFNEKHKKDGLLIDEIIAGGSFDKASSKVKAGMIIEAIDGVNVKSTTDYFPLLNNKTGKRTLISVYDPSTKKRFEEVVRPISKRQLNDLLHERWVKNCAEQVTKLSNGRLGYVHIASMSDEDFRGVYSDILGKYNNCEAIVIDTRHNGGGRMHEDIEILFSGKKYLTQVIRGVEVCDMPSRRWNKPSIMLMCESNYSNAHGTPWVYKNRGIGKLVGMPVPGTMTSVNWEQLIDNTMYFGIPVVGYRNADGQYLENFQLEPDFKVENSPKKHLNGCDEQLEKAVSEMLKELDANKKK